MKKVIITFAGIIAGFSLLAIAHEKEKAHVQHDEGTLGCDTALKHVGNELICPVDAKKFRVGDNTVFTHYKNLCFSFCSPECKEKFDENPQKYVKEEHVSSIEVGNKICPVMGEEIEDGKVFKVEYEGKIYNVCCKMCVGKFNRNPEKYLKE